MKRIDPADKIKEEKEEMRTLDDMEKLDIGKLKMSDFKVIPKSRARISHPFDGYPKKPPVKISDLVSISATDIVGLNPTAEPDHDRSGDRMSIINAKSGKEEIKTLKTFHSRVIRTGPTSNMDIVFDREFGVDDGMIHIAIVKDPYVRAQLFFYYDGKKERIEIDQKYLLLDMDQSARLRNLFQMIINPKLKREKLSAEVTGELDTSDKSLMSLPIE